MLIVKLHSVSPSRPSLPQRRHHARCWWDARVGFRLWRGEHGLRFRFSWSGARAFITDGDLLRSAGAGSSALKAPTHTHTPPPPPLLPPLLTTTTTTTGLNQVA